MLHKYLERENKGQRLAVATGTKVFHVKHRNLVEGRADVQFGHLTVAHRGQPSMSRCRRTACSQRILYIYQRVHAMPRVNDVGSWGR
jgi:hypothetical protein